MTDTRTQNRALVFTAAFIIIFCGAASAAFSVFSQPLQAATGGSASQVALTLTIYQFFMSLCGILSGKIVDRHGPKLLMYVGGVVFGLGWILVAFSNSLWMLYITCGVLAGSGNGLLYNPTINTAMKWYPEKKGTMSGLLLGAASLGPLVLAKVGAILCDRFGVNGFIYIGIAYWVLIWLVGWKMRIPPEGWRPEGWTPDAQANKASAIRSYTPGEMLRTATFWLLLALFSIACTSGIMMIGSLSSIAQVQLQMTALAAANMVVVNCLSNFVGRLIVGKLCDKLGELPTLLGALAVTIVALFGLRMSSTIPMFVVFLVFLGAAFGGVLVIFPPLTLKKFGIKHSGFNYGLMFFGYSIGAFIGPQIAAKSVDSALGTAAYGNAYLVAMGVAAIGILIDLLLLFQDKKLNK